MSHLIVPFFVSMVLALVATPLVRLLAIKVDLVDVPKDDRRMHNKPMPIAGGLAIALAFFVSYCLFIPKTKESLALALGSGIILLTGLYDDKYNMKARTKFALQLVAAAVLVGGGVKIDFFTNPFYGKDPLIYLQFLSIPITIFWIAGITNTINLIDGLDGLACGISGIAAVALMFVAHRYQQSPIAVLSAILAGSCLGFLPYNFNPAKIFMGDTGALFLGFVLAYITIEGVMKSIALIALFIPVLILGVPIFDTTFAMIRRKLSGHSIAQADKGHLHHRLLQRGLSQKKTVLSLYAVSIVFGIIGNIVSTMHEKNALIMTIIIFGAVGILATIFGLLKELGDHQ
ncbi:MAG: MraY family glycosyltransferase [Tissierellia bacterium]|nr:MraY family glycosyltransferase [Tissierellia bacterium]